ncbi:MAG: phosphoribosylaminoimidazolesuccinocarboxamide synthase [Deltaproteobacteria bacterium]|nr:phosphoribosylaminoimidazolesuccinocarboxamide synthase [Deltaproteobacteria bacterium]TLN04043.1 MAG: phosphoribosylaminoimidazolesuccinocarboxamide synthase [bacterium]
MKDIILTTDLPELKLSGRGKVRDIYDLGESLLIVTSDRISAFDVIMNEGIPGKGEVLTRISAHWFQLLENIVPHHLITTNPAEFPAPCDKYREVLDGRSMLVKKARPLPVECIVRGYLAGSGWKEYRETGSVCGIPLPPGLTESDRLQESIFTPSTKAELGGHDENISFDKMVELCGKELAEKVRQVSLDLYTTAREIANTRGIIIADTKFEFGLVDGKLILIDECLTPDSSRFWPKAGYCPGSSQPSFDKQFLRDYLETLDWDKKAPAPPLPDQVVKATARNYLEALERLM